MVTLLNSQLLFILDTEMAMKLLIFLFITGKICIFILYFHIEFFRKYPLTRVSSIDKNPILTYAGWWGPDVVGPRLSLFNGAQNP